MADLSVTPVVSVVVPILNEEEILRDNLATFAKAMDQAVGHGKWVYVLVDNGSTDRTPEIIDDVLQRIPGSIKVLEPIPNYGNALRAGLAAVETEWAKIIDVEQWDVPFLDWAWDNREPYDLLIGSKRADPTLNKQSPYRHFLSWGLNALIDLLFRYPGSDTHGPKLIRMATMRPIFEKCLLSRGQFDSEFTLRAFRSGLWIAEAPVSYREHRPPKNLMFKKIYWNIREFNRLRRVLQTIPYHDHVRLRRFCREDLMENTSGAAPD